jgi:Fic family protein
MVAATRALSIMIDRVTSSSRLELSHITDAHAALMADDPDEHTYAGRLRDMQNWVGGSNYSPRNALFVPPPPDTVEDYMGDLVAFANRDDMPALVQAAIAHAQFETIHPFTDGNGRTGRVMNILHLIQEELLNLPILYLSRHVIAHKTDYYGLLLGVTRDQAWEPWLLFMLQAVAETSKWTTGKIAAIRKLAEHTTEHVRTKLPKIYTRELVDVIFEQPYCRIGNLVDKGIAQRQAASRYLHDLAALGVLREMQLGKEKLFIHPKLMQLLSRDNNQFQPYA